MADRKTTSVDALYTEGRHYTRGQNRDAGTRRSTPHEPDMTARDQHRNQMPEDQHGPGYDNAVADDWRRGGGKGGATGKPGFDFGASYRRKDGGNDWNSTTQADKVSFVRPEPVTANKQQRRTGG
jgi:hypothetical protein